MAQVFSSKTWFRSSQRKDNGQKIMKTNVAKVAEKMSHLPIVSDPDPEPDLDSDPYPGA